MHSGAARLGTSGIRDSELGGLVWVLVRLLTVIKRKNPPIPVVHEL
jgi:hypothetical protein